MLSPYDYWQFWRNTDDRDVIRFLKMFTDLSLEELDNVKDKFMSTRLGRPTENETIVKEIIIENDNFLTKTDCGFDVNL